MIISIKIEGVYQPYLVKENGSQLNHFRLLGKIFLDKK
jgi:hypothetical protein